MKKEFKRLLSILLVLTLLGSTLPMSVSASALPTQNASAIENQEPTDASQNDTQNDAQDVTQNETQNEAQTEEAQESQQEVPAYANTLPSTIPAGETYTLSEDVTMESKGQLYSAQRLHTPPRTGYFVFGAVRHGEEHAGLALGAIRRGGDHQRRPRFIAEGAGLLDGARLAGLRHVGHLPKCGCAAERRRFAAAGEKERRAQALARGGIFTALRTGDGEPLGSGGICACARCRGSTAAPRTGVFAGLYHIGRSGRLPV